MAGLLYRRTAFLAWALVMGINKRHIAITYIFKYKLGFKKNHQEECHSAQAGSINEHYHFEFEATSMGITMQKASGQIEIGLDTHVPMASCRFLGLSRNTGLQIAT